MAFINPLTRLTTICRSIAQRWINWHTSKQRESLVKKARLLNNFVIATSMESATNHIIVFKNECYRVLIDPESINVINLAGKPIQDPDLIVQLLKRIHIDGSN